MMIHLLTPLVIHQCVYLLRHTIRPNTKLFNTCIKSPQLNLLLIMVPLAQNPLPHLCQHISALSIPYHNAWSPPHSTTLNRPPSPPLFTIFTGVMRWQRSTRPYFEIAPRFLSFTNRLYMSSATNGSIASNLTLMALSNITKPSSLSRASVNKWGLITLKHLVQSLKWPWYTFYSLLPLVNNGTSVSLIYLMHSSMVISLKSYTSNNHQDFLILITHIMSIYFANHFTTYGNHHVSALRNSPNTSNLLVFVVPK